MIAALLTAATVAVAPKPQPAYCPPRVVIIYRVPREPQRVTVYRPAPVAQPAAPRMPSPGWYDSIKTIEPQLIVNPYYRP